MVGVKPRKILAVLCCLAALPGGHALAHDMRAEIGYLDLIARLGAGNEPTGTNIIAGHTEAPDLNGNHRPNAADSHFVGNTFTFFSGGTGISSHATSVGRHIYSNTISAGPDIDAIHVYEANHWLGAGFLRTDELTGPNPTIVDFFNHSWIGDAGGFNDEILRRVDFLINDQDIMVVCGVGNEARSLTRFDLLLSHAYNVISVGRNDGNHHHGNTLPDVEGPGRMKPEITAPETATSWATGLVSGCVGALQETARTWTGLSSNTNADRPEVIKAALMAGTVHDSTWTNNPETSGPNRGVTTTPLDATFGAGFVNINLAHMVLTGLEQNSSTTIPAGQTANHTGWDLTPINAGQTRYYRFHLCEQKDEVTMFVTWNRRVATDFNSSTLPNLDVELFSVDAGGNLLSLRGGGGSAFFASGNIASESQVDNVELLNVRELEPGDYVLAVSRSNDALSSWDAAVAWLIPPDTAMPADLVLFQPLFGTVTAGDIDSLRASDGVVLRMRSQPGFTAQEPNITDMRVDFNTAVPSPTHLAYTFEGRMNQPGGIATIRLRNRATNALNIIGQFSIGSAEIMREFCDLDATLYVNAGGDVESRVKHSAVATFTAQGFTAITDFVGVGVN